MRNCLQIMMGALLLHATCAFAEDAKDISWHQFAEAPFKVSGLAWFSQDKSLCRMPLTSLEKLPAAVKGLSEDPAGGQIRFQTDSPFLSVKASLNGRANMAHMPATGQYGVDCYWGKEGEPLKFIGVTKYDISKDGYECAFFKGRSGEMRNVVLNLPLYGGLKDLQIGLAPGAKILPPPPYAIAAPVVIYGTSITQGACASRPGTCFTNILSRRLNVEFINLGFSGNGRGQPEVVEVIAQIKPAAMFIIDYVANWTQPEKTFPEMVKTIRASHPDTPILVLSQIPFDDPNSRGGSRFAVDFLSRQVAEFKKAGDNNIHFYDMDGALKDSFEDCTVDGVHPNDLGHYKMADALCPVVKEILKLDK